VFDRLLGKVAVGGDVDLAHSVTPYKLPADLSKLRSQKGFPTRKVQILNMAKGAREFKNFFFGKVVLLVKIAPIKTMLALHIAN
jgi:hypothetical protein